jgi:hypothetical protein
MNLSTDDQTTVTEWLKQTDLTQDINIYFYDRDQNTDWILYAAAVSDHKYINLDVQDPVAQALAGHLLGKYAFCYGTNDERLSDVYSRINSHKVQHIQDFLEGALGIAKTNNQS